MCYSNIEKREKTHDERNWISKQGKNQNACRKGNLQIPGNIGNGHHHISGDERKKIKKSISEKRENYSKPNYFAGTF